MGVKRGWGWVDKAILYFENLHFPITYFAGKSSIFVPREKNVISPLRPPPGKIFLAIPGKFTIDLPWKRKKLPTPMVAYI